MKTICVVTGSRAEYGLLKPLLYKIQKVGQWKLHLCVTGSHLSPDFGFTYKQIEEDGFSINSRIDIITSSDTDEGVAKSMALALSGMAEVFDTVHPDIVIILGDRYEMLAVASAALVMKVPVAHINGGDITTGAYDDAIRHAITKLSHLHFASADVYRKRIVQMGEHPDTVFNVGALGIDSIRCTKLLSKEELEKQLNFTFGERTFLVTYHPETLASETAEEQFNKVLQALENIPRSKVIFTNANADAGGKVINRMIDDFVARNPGKTIAFTSMGQLRYLSTMQFVQAVIGNSSSGIVEAPFFKTATINIGNRQDGRIRAKSIIDCKNETGAITASIDKSLGDSFRNEIDQTENPYGDGTAAQKIVDVLMNSLEKGVKLQKGFYDLNF